MGPVPALAMCWQCFCTGPHLFLVNFLYSLGLLSFDFIQKSPKFLICTAKKKTKNFDYAQGLYMLWAGSEWENYLYKTQWHCLNSMKGSNMTQHGFIYWKWNVEYIS